MKIIFVDIDGVYLTGKSHLLDVNIKKRLDIFKDIDVNNRELLYKARLEYCLSTEFDKMTIMLINRLAEKSGAKIVIHSNWRRSVGHEATKNKLIEQGIKESYFHKDYYCKHRMTSEKIHDIIQWLDEHRISKRPKQPKHLFPSEKGYDPEKQNKYYRDLENYGFDYVIIDDENICSGKCHDFQVITDFNEGFTLEEYRIACAILKTEDLQMNVHILSEEEYDRVRKHISNTSDFYYWLYSNRDNKGYTAPRATLLSFKEAEKVANEKMNPWYGITSMSAEDWYKRRSSDIWKNLEKNYNKEKIHKLIIEDTSEIENITNISISDFEKLPLRFPCVFIGTKKDPIYIYAPENVNNPVEFLFGYLCALDNFNKENF